jgi:hypothetical protein
VGESGLRVAEPHPLVRSRSALVGRFFVIYTRKVRNIIVYYCVGGKTLKKLLFVAFALWLLSALYIIKYYMGPILQHQPGHGG